MPTAQAPPLINTNYIPVCPLHEYKAPAMTPTTLSIDGPCFFDLAGNVCVGVLAKGLRMVNVGQLVDVLLVGLKWAILWDVVGW